MMQPYRISLLLFSTFILQCCSFAVAFKPKQKAPSPLAATPYVPKSRFDRVVQRIFDNADTNHDGSISFTECYELVLKLYININRQAPINPPSRETVHRMFVSKDVTRNKRLSRDEFTEMAKLLGRRFFVRLTVHKLITLLAAPIFAEYLVRRFTGTAWLHEFAVWVVPDRFEDRVLPVVTTQAFCRTVLIVIFVATLGNIVISAVNTILDSALPETKDSESKY